MEWLEAGTDRHSFLVQGWQDCKEGHYAHMWCLCCPA